MSGEGTTDPSWTRRSGWLLALLLLLTGLRLFLGARTELSPDESYYYQWSQRLDWSYFSKGPGVALVIRLGTELFGPTSLGVRFFSPLCGLGTSLLLLWFTRRLYGERVAVWTVLAINCVPIFNAGSVLMTIDPLSIFFWTAGLVTFWLALERAPRWSAWWPLTGVLIGGGFLAKYTNLMQLLSVVLLLAITRKHRGEFGRFGFWSLLLAFIPFSLPPVIWNSQHEWITLLHLRARGGLDAANEASAFNLGEFLSWFGQQAAVYSPLLFLALLFAIWRAWRPAATHFKARYLLTFTLPLLAMYAVLSFKQAGEPNWTAPAFISLMVLAGFVWAAQAGTRPWARKWVLASLALGILMSAAIVNTDGVRRLGIPWSYDDDPSSRLMGWRSAAERVGAFRKDFEQKSGQPVFLIANSYGTCSELAFYLPEPRAELRGHPPVYIPESQNIENQYSLWGRYDELTDLTAVAQELLKNGEGAQPTLKELNSALAGLPTDPTDPSDEAMEKRHRLVAALLAVNPKLPLDEFFTAEQGVSLFTGRTALYITDRDELHAPNVLKETFERTELVAQFTETRLGQPLRTIRIFACFNYHSLPL